MENVKDLVTKNSKYSLEASYHKACSDKDFSNYVKTLPIEEKELMKYTSSLEDCVEMRKKCRNCRFKNGRIGSVERLTVGRFALSGPGDVAGALGKPQRGVGVIGM